MADNRRKPSKNSRLAAPKGRLSEQAVAAARKLAAAGLSQRAIADRLRTDGLADVTQQAVCSALKRAEVEGSSTMRRRRLDARSAAVASAAVEPSDEDAELEAIRSRLAELTDAPSEVLEMIRRHRLPQVSQVATKALKSGNLGVARDAVRLEIEIAKQLVAATPAPPPDPADDPANTKARDTVRARLARMAAAARCRHCGELLNPAPSGEIT